MDKVRIEKLPETKEIDGAKRWVEDKGEFAQITRAHGEVLQHLAFFELKTGYSRGGHYHALKDETFYVISGVMRGICIDMDSGKKTEYTIRKGDKMHIEPRCGHIFYGLEDALVVEYSPQTYDKRDAYPVEFDMNI
jgi:oxalate decarboxylase/phosphoglucose isomerase-like protein (cupin superfamily)